MSLYAILETIRTSGDARVSEIESRAYGQCNQILAAARLEAEQAKTEAFAEAVAPAYRERARIIQRARLEALQILGDAREEFVDLALRQIKNCLVDIRAETNYPQILSLLIEEALAELKGSLMATGVIQLEAEPRDRLLLEGILDEMEQELPVRYVLECWGGLVAKSEDGRVVAINTMEARLERATPYLRRSLAALFENEGPAVEVSQVTERQTVAI